MTVNCPLCGYRFDSAKQTACSSCPINRGCNKVCCPNCGYGWVISSSIAGRFAKLIKMRGKSGKS